MKIYGQPEQRTYPIIEVYLETAVWTDRDDFMGTELERYGEQSNVEHVRAKRSVRKMKTVAEKRI